MRIRRHKFTPHPKELPQSYGYNHHSFLDKWMENIAYWLQKQIHYDGKVNGIEVGCTKCWFNDKYNTDL